MLHAAHPFNFFLAELVAARVRERAGWDKPRVQQLVCHKQQFATEDTVSASSSNHTTAAKRTHRTITATEWGQ